MTAEPDPSGGMDRLVESFLERQRRGERPSVEEYLRAYPELADQIREVFPALEMLEEFGPGETTAPPALAAPVLDRSPARLGEFRILREVGRGGMGVVYEAVQESLGRHVALKVLPRGAHHDEVYLRRFKREAQSAARLHHTGIVPVFSVGEDDGVCYYAMQYIAGQTLASVLREISQLRTPGHTVVLNPGSVAHSLVNQEFALAPTPQPASGSSTSAANLQGAQLRRAHYFRNIARIGAQVAEALAYAHGQGIVHRDVKPANLMLDLDGGVWVTDFGLAMLEGSEELTRTGEFLGTLRYAAPEQLCGKADARSDVYSLGITLYEMVTLRPAFDDPVKARLVDRILQEEPTTPGKLEPQLPRDLETIILKATAKEPRRRYESAQELAEDLRRFLGDRPVKARRVSRLEHAWRWCRRNRGVAGLLAAVIGLILAVAVISAGSALSLRTALSRAVDAEQDRKRQVYQGYVTEAKYRRYSRRQGQRHASLDAIRHALRLLPELGMSDEEEEKQRQILRDLAISCLTLPDVQVVKEWEGWPEGSFQLALDEGGEYYARSDTQGNVSVRRVRDDHEVHRIVGDGKPAWVYFAPGSRVLFLFRSGDTVEAWRTGESRPLFAFRAAGPPDRLRVAHNGRTLAVIQVDGTVTLYGLPDGTIRRREKVPPSAFPELEFSPDGRYLAAVGGDYRQPERQIIHLYDLLSPRPELVLTHPDSIQTIAWYPDGKVIAASGANEANEILLWEVPSGRKLAEITSQKGGFPQLSFNRTGDVLASTIPYKGPHWGGGIQMWDPRTRQELLSLPGAKEQYTVAAPDGRLFAHERSGTTIRLTECSPGHVRRTLVRHLGAPTGKQYKAPTLHPDGRLLAVSLENGVGLWDVLSGLELSFLSIGRTETAVFDSSGALWTYGDWGTLCWPVRTEPGARAVYQVGPPQTVSSERTFNVNLALSRDGGVAAAARASGDALVFHRGRPHAPVPLRHQENVRDLAVSPDGRFVATCSHGEKEGGAKVWEAATGKQLVHLAAGEAAGRAAFTKDGRWLVVGSRWFAVGSWEEGPSVRGWSIKSGCISADATCLACFTGEEGIKLFDRESGRRLAELGSLGQGSVHTMTFNHDATQLIGTDYDNLAIHVWDLRSLRAELARLDLDWDAPAYRPAPAPAEMSVEVKVDLGPQGHREGERLAREGKWPEAVAAWKKSLEANPNQADVHRRIAETLLHRPPRDPAAALLHAERAAVLAPRPDTLFLRGEVRYTLKEYEQARDDFSACLERDAAHTEAYHFRAHCHEYLGAVRAAIEDVDKALALKAGDVHFHEMKAGYHLRLKEYAPMLAAAERAAALQTQPRAQTVTLLGLAHSRLGSHAKAVPHLLRAAELAKDGPSGTVLLALAISQHHVGRAREAQDNYQKALAWRKAHSKLTVEQAARFDEFRAEAEKSLGVK